MSLGHSFKSSTYLSHTMHFRQFLISDSFATEKIFSICLLPILLSSKKLRMVVPPLQELDLFLEKMFQDQIC